MSSSLTENESPLLNLASGAASASASAAAVGGAEDVAVQSATTTTTVRGDTERTLRFPVWIQLLGVGAYFSLDIFLRFLYQDVLEGRHGSSNNNEEEEEGYDTDSSSSSSSSYEKPALLTLCCYMMFLLWGPILVFPYIVFYRRLSIQEYYTTEWCGALGFWHAAGQYTVGMGIVLYFANLGYVAGLRYIHASLGSALSQGEAPFTVLLSVVILGRIFGVWEKRGIALCFSGIAMITIPPVLKAYDLTPANDDQDDGSSSGRGGEEGTSAAFQMISGVISTLIGAFGFGAYQVFWPLFDGKRYTTSTTDGKLHQPPAKPADAIIDTFATLTLVGLFMVLFGWIFILLLHVTGVEVFEFPPENARGALFRASAASGVVDALNGLACVVAGAVVVALAYPLIIPMSVVLDYWWNGHSIRSWGAFGWIGTIIVIAGVFCLEANPPPPQDENESPCVEKDESRVEENGGDQELQEYSMSPSAPITADYVSIT